MAEPPRGTITLLFTDIAGSTRLWQQHGAAMHEVIAGHDALVKTAVEAYGGTVFKTVGDGVYTAFATAPDALQAALAIQRALAAEWGVLGELRVRMALHTGAVEARDGDYFGLALSRAARLLAAGHGGQILLSLAAHELTCDTLPPEVALRDLGRHQLKDLARPEQIFQAIAPDLPADFPTLATLDRRPHNLPAQATPLVGREREIAQGLALLARPEVRLATLTGPGGVGKTRLALQLAAELVDVYPDGVWFVNLAPVTDPRLVASTIAQTLDVREARGTPLLELLAARLRERELLLILDNFEQVIAAADVVAELLAAAPRIKILVTSRMTLRLYGEHEYAVPPLSLPDPKRLPTLERLSQYEAVRLFIERARAAKADFAITSTNAPAVAQICARLDGLPLAIELAAARIKLLTPEALLARLERRLGVLTGGARDLPARQQTLRNTIDWSYSLLDPAERRLFARLAVFVGGRTLEAIEAVCNPGGELGFDSLDGLASLLDKSLLLQEEGPGNQPRFVMLETLHEYAREKLEESGEAEEVRRRHAKYFLALAQRAEPELVGQDRVQWLARLVAEHENVRTAAETLAQQAEVEALLLIGKALWRFWLARGYISENRRWLETALMWEYTGPVMLRARALAAAGQLALYQGDLLPARRWHEESLALFRKLGDTRGVSMLLYDLSGVAVLQGDTDYAQQLGEESLALRRTLGHSSLIAHALSGLADIARHRGEYARARELLEEALTLERDSSLYPLYDQLALAMVILEAGDYEGAEPLLVASLRAWQTEGDYYNIAVALAGLAGVAAAKRHGERAAVILGVVEPLLQRSQWTLEVADRRSLDHTTTLTRTQLGDVAFAAAYAAGRALSLDEALALALEPLPASPVPPVPAPALPSGLSEREAEVLRLVAQGLTNAQIAERLVLSPYTVNAHLRTIYGKIGVNSRAAATRWADGHGLV